MPTQSEQMLSIQGRPSSWAEPPVGHAVFPPRRPHKEDALKGGRLGTLGKNTIVRSNFSMNIINIVGGRISKKTCGLYIMLRNCLIYRPRHKDAISSNYE